MITLLAQILSYVIYQPDTVCYTLPALLPKFPIQWRLQTKSSSTYLHLLSTDARPHLNTWNAKDACCCVLANEGGAVAGVHSEIRIQFNQGCLCIVALGASGLGCFNLLLCKLALERCPMSFSIKRGCWVVHPVSPLAGWSYVFENKARLSFYQKFHCAFNKGDNRRY